MHKSGPPLTVHEFAWKIGLIIDIKLNGLHMISKIPKLNNDCDCRAKWSLNECIFTSIIIQSWTLIGSWIVHNFSVPFLIHPRFWVILFRFQLNYCKIWIQSLTVHEVAWKVDSIIDIKLNGLHMISKIPKLDHDCDCRAKWSVNECIFTSIIKQSWSLIGSRMVHNLLILFSYIHVFE